MNTTPRLYNTEQSSIFFGLLWAAAALLALTWIVLNNSLVLSQLWAWTPSLLKGLGLNLLIGLVAMALASTFGAALGCVQLAPGLTGRAALIVTQLLRSLPWLVVVFYVAYLLPFEVQIHNHWVTLSDWMKVAAGLAIPATGYVSEFVRGSLQAIPVTQWEAADSLAMSPRQRLRWVVLPQALRALLPPWMNLFCAVVMSTSLAHLLGVEELMTTLQMHLSSNTKPDLLLPAYLYAFLAFFFCVYPFSLWSRRLEKRWSLSR